MILQEIKRCNPGGEYLSGPCVGDAQYDVNIREQLEEVQAPQDVDVEDQQDPMTQTNLEEGETAAEKLKS